MYKLKMRQTNEMIFYHEAGLSTSRSNYVGFGRKFQLHHDIILRLYIITLKIASHETVDGRI